MIYLADVRKNLFVCLILIACVAQAAAAEEIKLAAAYSAMANIFSKISKPFEEETGIKIALLGDDPKGMAADAAFQMVNDDKAEAGAAGSGWETLMALVKEKGITVLRPLFKVSSHRV